MIDTTMATHWALLALLKYWWPSQSLAPTVLEANFEQAFPQSLRLIWPEIFQNSWSIIAHTSALEMTQLSNVLITYNLFRSPIIVLSKQIIGRFGRKSSHEVTEEKLAQNWPPTQLELWTAEVLMAVTVLSSNCVGAKDCWSTDGRHSP